MSSLLDILQDEKLDLADVLIKTNIEKLTLLTAGRRHSHSTELLASQSMADLLKELAENARLATAALEGPNVYL